MTDPKPLVNEASSGLDRIQAPVRDRLDLILDEIRRIVVADFEMIEEVNEYLLLLPGKLFRPTLALLSNEVGGSPHRDAVTFGAVLELVHLATLVHDDAVDHSVLRRGQPTVNAIWTHQIAIIMGDYLYSRALTELARVGHLEAVRTLGEAANVMSVGEMRQLTAFDGLDFSEDDYQRLIAAKTASLMGAACDMGALVGVERFRVPLKRFGTNLGMAFQVADDILDYVGSQEETGKPAGQDLRERKVTLPLIGALKTATPAAEAEIRGFFGGGEPTDEEISRVIELVRELGGVDYAKRQAFEYAEKAEEALSGLPEGEAVEALRDSITYVVDRNR
ncbi:MAG: polyprenyl synthetase family protein [Gemmatimonadetes bacterium]|nr:polyprenyl synthetase family protein [Gemmatimonadota bacterium]